MERPQTFQVFVISLERAVERREYMRNLIADLGFNATIISAVDGKKLRPEQRAPDLLVVGELRVGGAGDRVDMGGWTLDAAGLTGDALRLDQPIWLVIDRPTVEAGDGGQRVTARGRVARRRLLD